MMYDIEDARSFREDEQYKQMQLDYMMFDCVVLSIGFAVLLGFITPCYNDDWMPF